MAAGDESQDEQHAAPVYELLVSLLELERPVERRLLVRGDCTLAQLHRTIQAAMGWRNDHLYVFTTTGDEPLTPNGDRRQLRAERRLRLNDLLQAPGERLDYEYDFGDRWRHRVEFAGVAPPVAERSLPSCIDGQGACPPEDCGGPPGYAELLGALADPVAEEHLEWAEWVGHTPERPFDPTSFDRDAANRRLRSLRGMTR